MPRSILVCSLILSVTAIGYAQGTSEDYRRASALRGRYDGLAINVVDGVTWIDETREFSYRRSVRGGHEFVVMNADTREKRPAFDHERLASVLSAAAGGKYTAAKLPFNAFRFVDTRWAIETTFDGSVWRCSLSDYRCRRQDLGGRGGRGGGLVNISPTGGPPPACAPRPTDVPMQSPDRRFEALILNYNLAIRESGKRPKMLSTDGSEGNCYQPSSIRWSPESSKIVAYRVKPGYRRMVYYVESSPEDQLQPKNSSRFYAKPGDVLDTEQPVLFDVASGKQIAVDNTLFPYAYDVTELAWRRDSSAVTFEYNQRGHQVYRVIEINASTGATRAVISEEPKTFFNYRTSNGGLSLYDGATGKVKNQITKGNWVVRGIQKVDEAKRQIWFTAGGTDAGKDPYFAHFYRINFDGSGLTRLTSADANHNIVLSRDMQFFVDTYSRVDLAPIVELRRADEGALVSEIDRGDISELLKAGWRPPEVFTALGRDGKTDIWGVMYRPTNFDATQKYPVIENVYAGPQGSFVPKSLVVGEIDTNVDPSSTLPVANALIKANKYFDLLYIPGAGHGSGAAYGERKRFDFFVQHLLGVRPPDWNSLPPLIESAQPE